MTAIHEIITHDYPDQDAILSVLLLRQFGEAHFPGVSTAPVIFYSAGQLPDGRSPDELEREGILAVDTGGGRFDSHPDAEGESEGLVDRCASHLIAEALGVLDHPEWAALIEAVRRQDTEGKSILSTDPIHHLMTIPNILSGIEILYSPLDDASDRILEAGLDLMVLPSISLAGRRTAGDRDRSTLILELVDRYLTERGVDTEQPAPEHEALLEWRRRLSTDPATAYSDNPADEVHSLPILVDGLCRLYSEDVEQVWIRLSYYFDTVTAREARWREALADVDANGRAERIGKKVIVASITSANGMVIKALRFRTKADIIVYRDPETGATSILLKRNGPLRHFRMSNLAAKVRLAEVLETGHSTDLKRLTGVGMIDGWFLHQSCNMLIRGSKKASSFQPSTLPLELLTELAIGEIDRQRKLPAKLCPDDRCLYGECAFYELHLQNCKYHRYTLRRKTARPAVAPKPKPTPKPTPPRDRPPSNQRLSAFGEKLLEALQGSDTNEAKD